MAVDTSVYENQRRNITNDYATRAATNAYSRFLSQQRSDRNIADYTRDFRRAAPKYSAGWGRRGLTGGGVQSGVYQNAMRNYVGDYSQNVARMYADQATQDREFDLTAAQQEAAKNSALADLETQKQREIANAALYLTALKPTYGG